MAGGILSQINPTNPTSLKISVAVGNATLVAANATKKIAVLGYILAGDTSGTTLTFKSNATSISGDLGIPLLTSSPFIASVSDSDLALFETEINEPLVATAATGTVTGVVIYQEID